MFSNYQRLIEKVDRHLRTLPACACPGGCSVCCRAGLSLFPVEAFYLRRAFRQLPAGLRELATEGLPDGDGDACPLLLDGRCLLYEQRPMLCRTHGHPFILRPDGGPEPGSRVLHPGCEVLGQVAGNEPPGEAGSFLDMDRLNRMLVAVNELFLACLPSRSAGVPFRVRMERIVAANDRGGFLDAHL
ncbi:MAG: YkgJ family cysteine cluster protein [bacterium]